MGEINLQQQETENKSLIPSINVTASPYTINEAAVVLRMSTKSVRRQIDRGNLRRCSTFGRVLIPRKDVDNFMEKHSSYAF